VFRLARGTYFKWAAHDDICAPDFLKRWVETCDADSGVVLVYPRVTIIDAKGERIRDYDEEKDLSDSSPYIRFRRLMFSPGECNAVFGLIRSAALRRTRLIQNFDSSDRNLLAALSLRGRFAEIPERLFFRRDHPKTSRRAWKTSEDIAGWFDPLMRGRPLVPTWRAFGEYSRAIVRSPVGVRDRLACLALIARVASWRRQDLWQEATEGTRLILRRLACRPRDGDAW